MVFIVRLLVNATALWAATRLVPGVDYTGGWAPFLGVALVFGFVNAFIRPVAKILAFPLILITLGLFSIVINALMLWLTSALSAAFGFGFHVRGFWAAVFGAIVVSIISTLIAMMMNER